MQHFFFRFLSFLPVIHFIVNIVLVFGQYTKVLAFVKRFALILRAVARTSTYTIIIHWRVSLDFVLVFVLFCSGRTSPIDFICFFSLFSEMNWFLSESMDLFGNCDVFSLLNEIFIWIFVYVKISLRLSFSPQMTHKHSMV